jgi:hypothetical protein
MEEVKTTYNIVTGKCKGNKPIGGL